MRYYHEKANSFIGIYHEKYSALPCGKFILPPTYYHASSKLDNLHIMTPLVTVNNNAVVQCCTIPGTHGFHHLNDEIYFKAFTQRIGKHLMGTDVQDGRQITNAIPVKQERDIRQQRFARWICLKFPVENISC